jgi:DnaJ-class molecular chaperone
VLFTSRRQQNTTLKILYLLNFVIFHACGSVEVATTYYDVLDVPSNASSSDVRKSYRRLALDYHPDKVSQFNANVTDERRAEVEEFFLRIQLAYEILGDTERRLKYDLSLSGVHYDIIDENSADLLTTGPYSIFLRSIGPKTSFKLHFTVFYPKPSIPDILLSIDVPLRRAMEGLKIRQKYYHKTICTACKGKGGLDGSFRECSVCNGTGTARILHSSNSNDQSDVCFGNQGMDNCCGNDVQNHDSHCPHRYHQYRSTPEGKKEFLTEKMTTTTCPSCRGKGTLSVGRCAVCNGSGKTNAIFRIRSVV